MSEEAAHDHDRANHIDTARACLARPHMANASTCRRRIPKRVDLALTHRTHALRDRNTGTESTDHSHARLGARTRTHDTHTSIALAVDRIRTHVALDRTRTHVALDRPRTHIALDRTRTHVALDRPRTHVALNRTRADQKAKPKRAASLGHVLARAIAAASFADDMTSTAAVAVTLGNAAAVKIDRAALRTRTDKWNVRD
jgi:hypothetical protein